MLGLKDSCVHPTSQKPYIKSASGGKDNSSEGIQVSSLGSQRTNSEDILLMHDRMALHTHLS